MLPSSLQGRIHGVYQNDRLPRLIEKLPDTLATICFYNRKAKNKKIDCASTTLGSSRTFSGTPKAGNKKAATNIVDNCLMFKT